MQRLALILLLPSTALAGSATLGTPAAMTGTKGTLEYTVRSRVPADLPEALEITLDLSEILSSPDPEYGTRKPLALVDPVVTAHLPGDSKPRQLRRLWPGEQAGQYRTQYRFREHGYGTLRIDAKTEAGAAIAVLLPVTVGEPKRAQFTPKMLATGEGTPAPGDEALGKLIFAKSCACCHGKDVLGAAPKAEALAGDSLGARPPKLHDAEFAWNHTDEHYRKAIAQEPLYIEDVIAYLQPFRPSLRKVTDKGSRYVARHYAMDQTQQKRLRRLLNRTPKHPEVALFALYGAAEPGKEPTLLENEARALDQAKPKQRQGYVAIVKDEPGAALPELWLTLSNELQLEKLWPRDDKSQPLPKPGLAAFEGQGSRDEADFPGKDGVNKNEPLALRVASAYLIARLGVQVYEEEETERSWGD